MIVALIMREIFNWRFGDILLLLFHSTPSLPLVLTTAEIAPWGIYDSVQRLNIRRRERKEKG